MPRKSLNPEAPWDWLRISERVQGEFTHAKEQKEQAGGTLNQTDFGRPYGFTQGEISKLINRKFSEPSIKLQKGLTAMLVEIPRVELAELPELGDLDPGVRRARSVQDSGAHSPKLIAEVIGMALTPEEQQLCFPLCRALIHLLRRNDHTFAHLLEQTRWALNMEGDGDNDDLHELIRRFEKLKGYSIVPGKPTVSRKKRAPEQ